MYQNLTLVGRLGRDPEMRYAPSGTPVTNISIAVDKKFTDREGNKVEKTTWFKIEAWGKLGEIINQYTHKGDLVMVVGEIKPARPYKKDDGEPGCQLEVIASQVRFLSSKNGAPEASADEPQVAEVEEIPF